MTRKIVSFQLSVFSILFFMQGFCFAQLVSSAELINNAKQYDGQIVSYEGEVIGDIMVRGDFAWVNVNDGVNAIGIWVDKNLIKDILYTGSYKYKGDWVEVEGIFHRACTEHGGDLDIHANELRKIKAGSPVIEKPISFKINLAIILVITLCIIIILKILKII